MTNEVNQKKHSGARLSLHRPHRGEAVKVGRYQIFLGGTRYFQPEDLREADILIPLTSVPYKFGSCHKIDLNTPGVGQLQILPQLERGRQYSVLAAPLVDFGGVPAGWESLLRNQVTAFADRKDATRLLHGQPWSNRHLPGLLDRFARAENSRPDRGGTPAALRTFGGDDRPGGGSLRAERANAA